ILDQAFIQFPNLSFLLQIEERQESERIKLSRSFHFVLSLLTNHYTYYFKDSYSLKEFATEDMPAPAINAISCSILTEYYNAYKALEENVVNLVEEYYPNYRYIHHHVLFDVKLDLKIILPNTLTEPPYSLFSYLFDD